MAKDKTSGMDAGNTMGADQKPVLTDMDQKALDAATSAGLDHPAKISDTHVPTPEELHLRVQTLEAIVAHLCDTYMRGIDVGALVAQHRENIAGSEVIDPMARGRG
jgi:hypothetical protein